jgi:putative SOS response-associated peptidase YedK
MPQDDPVHVWQGWYGRNGIRQGAFETDTIITTDPNDLITYLSIHDRMPVILSPSDYARWLDPGDPDRLPVDLLRPFDEDLMRAWKVGPDVGNVKNDLPDLCEPVSEQGG